MSWAGIMGWSPFIWSGLNPDFSFTKTTCYNSLPYYSSTAGCRISGFMPFPGLESNSYLSKSIPLNIKKEPKKKKNKTKKQKQNINNCNLKYQELCEMQTASFRF